MNTFTREEYNCLCHGYLFYDRNRGMDGRSLWKSESLRTEMAGAWQFLRPQILKEWVRKEPRRDDDGGAGSRPAGFWVFDAPERRRCLNGLHPLDDPAREARITEIVGQYPHRERDFRYLFYGMPGAFVVPSDHTRVYETQFDYLKRLGLLMEGEEELYAELLRLQAERERREREDRALRLEDMEL